MDRNTIKSSPPSTREAKPEITVIVLKFRHAVYAKAPLIGFADVSISVAMIEFVVRGMPFFTPGNTPSIRSRFPREAGGSRLAVLEFKGGLQYRILHHVTAAVEAHLATLERVKKIENSPLPGPPPPRAEIPDIPF